MNLLIVSWVTPTPGCTANFPGNRCSQPLILRPFGRFGQELPVECQVEPFSTLAGSPEVGPPSPEVGPPNPVVIAFPIVSAWVHLGVPGRVAVFWQLHRQL
jgi:hypothetical protein